jgi:hypothetical protein
MPTQWTARDAKTEAGSCRRERSVVVPHVRGDAGEDPFDRLRCVAASSASVRAKASRSAERASEASGATP